MMHSFWSKLRAMTVLAGGAIDLRESLERGHGDHGKIWYMAAVFIIGLWGDEHIAGKHAVPGHAR